MFDLKVRLFLGVGTLATGVQGASILGSASLVAWLPRAPQPRSRFPPGQSPRPRQKGASSPRAVGCGTARASGSDETTSTAAPTPCSDSTWAGSGPTPE